MATLYLVSTPVGNLEDLTHRAERVLGEADRVLAEDTRRTGRLLKHLGLSVRLVSYHAHNEVRRTEEALAWMADGEALALVTDAGTPLLSDPGQRLVEAALDAGHEVVAIPGPSAVTAALVASGLPAVPFTFLGFIPRKGRARTSTLERVATSEETVVVFESPARLKALLDDLEEACGAGRRVAVCRELTKMHEEVVRGTLAEAGRYYEGERVRGEVTVVIAPGPEDSSAPDEVDEAAARVLARVLLEGGTSPSRAAKEVSRRLEIPRNAAYDLVQQETGRQDDG